MRDPKQTEVTVCVLGLGLVGLPLAALFASRQSTVIGVDTDEALVADLRSGRARRLHGDGVHAVLTAAAGRIRFTTRPPIAGCAGIYVVAVATPADAERGFDRRQFDDVALTLERCVRPGDLVIMRSTAPIGATRQLARRLPDVDVACCPDRSVAGNIFDDIQHLPQIVGGVTHRAATRAADLFASLGVDIVAVENADTAEAIKLVANAQRDAQFALTNEVAMMCDAAGLDAHHVLESGARSYPRHWLPPPGPVGGPCLIKDTILLAESVAVHGTRPELALAARRVNGRVAGHAAAFIARHIACREPPGSAPVIAILGVAFKGIPETAVVQGSFVGPLRDALAATMNGCLFRGWDPVVPSAEIESIGLEPFEQAAEAVAGADVVVLANDHPSIAALPFGRLARRLRPGALIYDFWGWERMAAWRLPANLACKAFGGHAGRASPVKRSRSSRHRTPVAP